MLKIYVLTTFRNEFLSAVRFINELQNVRMYNAVGVWGADRARERGKVHAGLGSLSFPNSAVATRPRLPAFDPFIYSFGYLFVYWPVCVFVCVCVLIFRQTTPTWPPSTGG